MTSPFREPPVRLKSHNYTLDKAVSDSRVTLMSATQRRIEKLAVVAQERERSKRNDGPQRLRGGVALELGLDCE